MTVKTRYFVIVSLLILVVGLGTGLVAYFVGFPGIGLARGGPDELQYVPPTATVVAFADVREVMSSDLRRRLHDVLPDGGDGQREFENETGINIERDIDQVVAFAEGGPASAGRRGSGLVLARGRFDAVKIEALLRQHGAQVDEYGGKRLFVTQLGRQSDQQPVAADSTFGLVFLEPGLVALGSGSLLRGAVDRQAGGENLTDNDDMMALVRSLQGANNAWVVGRFDTLTAEAGLPANISSRLPPITWFSIGAHINDGISGTFTAETRDEAGATNLREVVQGLLALAKMQAGSRPELQTAMESLIVGGQGTTVTLSFAVPSSVIDLMGAAVQRNR
jgi:hypothetical protein